MATRKELIEGVGQRYRASSGQDKPKILGEFVRLTGYPRKHANPRPEWECGQVGGEATA
jgi:hypothetical protein